MPVSQISGSGDSHSSQGLRAALTLPVILKLALGVACAVSCALCIWMEIGPYEWIADLLSGNGASYSTTTAKFGTFLVMMLPAFLVWPKGLWNPKRRDSVVRAIALVLMASALGMAGFAWYQIAHSHSVRKADGIQEAARLATFIVRDVRIESLLRPSDFRTPIGIKNTKGGTEASTTYRVHASKLGFRARRWSR